MNNERYGLIKNVRLLNPAEKKSDGCDILFVRKDKKSEIVKIGKNLRVELQEGMTVVNAHGRTGCSPFTDLRCAIPDSANDIRERFDSGLAAAVAGGYIRVLLMPAFSSVPDKKATVTAMIKRGRQASDCRVIPCVPLTEGGEGKKLCAFEELKAVGAGAITAGYEISEENSAHCLAAVRAAGKTGMLYISACGDKNLDQCGSVNAGRVSRMMKKSGIEPLSEILALQKAIAFARTENLPVYFPLVTLKESVDAVRKAKAEGVPIHCGTSAVYFSFTENEILFSGNNAKVLPPLRTEADRLAVIEGLKDQTVDCICSDHVPCHANEKKGDWEKASFGAVGLETAFAAGITHLVLPGHLSVYRLIELMSCAPAQLLGIQEEVAIGKPMNLAFIDVDEQLVYGKDAFKSRSFNTPFFGRALYGRVTGLYIDGQKQF